ncbi:hypothetical protein EST38_g2502 [Candolleomyces aberdarensis]|uniref:Uncharacterized protein n=1 Tax=Candolleomyces aberdarensis TaxID=2316362 RepID=A0A4Q2DSY1_9AGAR|nr:hypothetical protein EST38_g2502 [Candolleomyces aberdarensis]
MDQFAPLLDPVLDFLAERLPPPVYSILINSLSHFLAVTTTAFRLLGSIITKGPQEWDLQNILPPILTLLAAYMALASAYRTTTWLFRITIFCLKWGSVIGILSMGAGWLAALNGDGNNALGNTNGRSRGTSRSNVKPRARVAGTGGKKYSPLDKFDEGSSWQYQEPGKGQEILSDAQNIMQNIVGTANQVLENSGFWQVAKVMAGIQQPEEQRKGGSQRKAGRSKTKSR